MSTRPWLTARERDEADQRARKAADKAALEERVRRIAADPDLSTNDIAERCGVSNALVIAIVGPRKGAQIGARTLRQAKAPRANARWWR